MLASVIIPVYNRKDSIEPCLESVLNQDFSDYEVIVIDDGSTDGTKDILKKYANRVRLHFHETNQGVSESRNQGIRLAQSNFIAVTDSDCVVEPTWLKELIKPFSSDDKLMIVGGKVSDSASRSYWQTVNRGLHTFVSHKSQYVKQVVGCNLAFRREFIGQNLYDYRLRFAAGDDTELCWRCRSLGFKVYYTQEARVTHFHRASLKGSVIQAFLYGYINSYTTLKHREFPYLNYGSRLILFMLGLCVLGIAGFKPAYWGLVIGVALFSYLPLYHSMRPKTKTTGEVIWTYPGNYLVYMSFCLGSLFYFFFPSIFLNPSAP
jgi:glycosyltransferase involved in cell wall biosynthesis